MPDEIKQDNTAETALVPFNEAGDRSIVAVSGDEFALKKKQLSAALSKSQGYGMWSLQTVLVASTVGLMFTPAAILALLTGIGSFFALMYRAIDANPSFSAQDAVSSFKSNLRAEFKRAQENVYQGFQIELLRDAEQTLEKGELINEQQMAYLACVRTELLRKASDQLAISVLQARQLLNFTRRIDDPEALNESKTQPFTFKNQKLQSSNEYQRNIMRQSLWANLKEPKYNEKSGRVSTTYSAIKEDSFPVHQEPDFSKLNGALGVSKGFASYFLGPVVSWKFNKAILQECKEIPAVEVPGPAIAEDFAERLAHYEKNVECLDLPAMRGWAYRPMRQKSPEIKV